MTPAEIYKTILNSITQVRNVRAERTTRHTLDGTPHADDSLLDEMARNSAQALLSFTSLNLDELEQLVREEIPLGRDGKALYAGVMCAINELRIKRGDERFRETTRAALRDLPENVFEVVAARCRVSNGGCFCGCHVSQVPA